MTTRSALGLAAGLLAAFALGWVLRGPADADDPTAQLATSQGDAAAALEAILSIDAPRERTRALLDLLDRTHPSAGLLLHEKLVELRRSLSVDEITEILVADWWAQAAPEIAFAHPIDPPWPDRHPWARTVLGVWVERDPSAAALAAQAMPSGPGGGRSAAARAVVDGWLALETLPDPTPLLGVLGQLEPIARGGALLHIAKTLIEDRGIDEALAVIRAVPPDDALKGSVQQELLARTGVALLDFDPQRAVAWAAEHADSPAGPGIHKHIAYYWALREGRPALDWALALPDDPAKSTIVKRAWISFSRKHKENARAWLLEHPPHPLMRATYRQFIRKLASTDPEGAFELAERAAEPGLRDDLRAAAGEGWMQLDPEAASAWLADADLPPDLAARVRAAGSETRAPRPG